jgi:hypothetical protein
LARLPSQQQQRTAARICIGGGPLLSFFNKVVAVNSTTTITTTRTKDPETEMQVNIESDVNKRKNQYVNTQNETTQEEEEYQYQQHQSQPSLSNFEDPSRSTIEDWDVQLVWSRMMHEVNNAKIERRQELLSIEQRTRELNEESNRNRCEGKQAYRNRTLNSFR